MQLKQRKICSKDSSVTKTSKDKEQKTVRIPATEDTWTCTKDCNNKESKDVKQDQPGNRIPVKSSQAKKQKKSVTAEGMKDEVFLLFVSPEV